MMDEVDESKLSHKQQLQQWKSRNENDTLSKYGGRDICGLGAKPKNIKWPDNAKVAISFCIHLEEGGEKCILHGDHSCEVTNFSSDKVIVLENNSDDRAVEGKRDLVNESLYEYGSRVGFWRLHRLFTQRKIPCTLFAVGMALERNPAIRKALKDTKGWEISSQGYRLLDYQNVDEKIERDHIDRSVAIHDNIFEQHPSGFFQPKPNLITRKLVVGEGGFKYDSNSYAEDLPYWTTDYGEMPHLIIPYSLTENDIRFVTANGFATGSQFFEHLKRTLNELIEDGRNGNRKMMTISLHCRLARPGRIAGLVEFLDYIQKNYSKKDVWIATREKIADFWFENHYPLGAGSPVKQK